MNIKLGIAGHVVHDNAVYAVTRDALSICSVGAGTPDYEYTREEANEMAELLRQYAFHLAPNPFPCPHEGYQGIINEMKLGTVMLSVLVSDMTHYQDKSLPVAKKMVVFCSPPEIRPFAANVVARDGQNVRRTSK